jgi:hypothetical protein
MAAHTIARDDIVFPTINWKNFFLNLGLHLLGCPVN